MLDFGNVCSDLKQARIRLLELLPDPYRSTDHTDTALMLYLAVLRGFLEVPQGGVNTKGAEDVSHQSSKLRHALRYSHIPWIL